MAIKSESDDRSGEQPSFKSSLQSNKNFIGHILLFSLILVVVTCIFLYGWYIDPSHALAAAYGADQATYTNMVNLIMTGSSFTGGDLHFSIGYSLLGVIGALLDRSDPFMLTSLILLLASVAFCYFASIRLIGAFWTIIFMSALLWWDLLARTFNYSFELFITPWNNQVLFFVMAYFFWLLSKPASSLQSLGWTIITGVAVGITVLSREEAVLFCAPLIIAYLLISKANWKRYVLMVGIVSAIYMPQIWIRIGADTNAGGYDRSYASVAAQYFNPSQLKRNLQEVIVGDGGFSGESRMPEEDSRLEGVTERDTLLESSPWLWLSPIGFLIILASKRYPIGTKMFAIVSVFLAIFYLSGANMSDDKLKYHCLRYISPSFILLHFASVVTIHTAFRYVGKACIIVTDKLNSKPRKDTT